MKSVGEEVKDVSRKDTKVISVSVPSDLLKEFDAAGAAHCKSIGMTYKRSTIIAMCMLSLVLDFNKKSGNSKNNDNKEDK